MEQPQLTNKQIASLLHDIFTCNYGKEPPLKDGASYSWTIDFTIKDDYLEIGENSLARKTKVVENV